MTFWFLHRTKSKSYNFDVVIVYLLYGKKKILSHMNYRLFSKHYPIYLEDSLIQDLYDKKMSENAHFEIEPGSLDGVIVF